MRGKHLTKQQREDLKALLLLRMPMGKTAKEVAEEFGCDSDTARKYARAMGLRRAGILQTMAAERGMMGFAPVLPGYAIKQTSTQRGPEGETQREWIQQRKAPGAPFEMPEGHVVKGVSALVDQDGRTIQQWVKTREDGFEETLAAIKTAFEEYRGVAEPTELTSTTDSDLLSVYPIADQHLGLMAWGQETGESYDLKIGAERLRSCMRRLIEQSPSSGQAIILNLGDWTHQDDNKNMTPRSGNILDVDGRYQKVLTTGVEVMMDCIRFALEKHESVLVRNLPGNHDPHASIALTVALGAFYANEPRVTVDADPGPFFFHRFGATLIGATHGHRLKPADMAMTMATTQREAWGETAYHWFLYGHIHHERAQEVGDVRCESFRTLAAKDAWAHGAGYSPGQSLVSVTLHRQDGEIGRHRVNLPPPSFRRKEDTR